MARIIYSALIESIRGSIGGTTFQRNAYGYTIKKKPTMVNPNTQPQTREKLKFNQVQQAWLLMSDSDRQQWNTWAEQWPVPARLNPNANLSGMAQFTRRHMATLLHFYEPVPLPFAERTAVSDNGSTVFRQGNQLYIGLDINHFSGSWKAVIHMSPELGAAWTTPRGTLRKITERTDPQFDSIIDITNEYLFPFASLPSLGSKVAVQIICYDVLTPFVYFFNPVIVEVEPLA